MSDKRSVSTDALETLGTIIDEGQKRDAIHLAVEPVVAGQRLEPGDHVTVKDGVAGRAGTGACLGIVDPFLESSVEKGQRFWFVMYPRKVTSLRHVWSHPAFPDEPVVASAQTGMSPSEKWIRDYASELDLSYEELMAGAALHLKTGEYLHGGSNLEGRYDDDFDKFWAHYDALTGEVNGTDPGNFFSCSC